MTVTELINAVCDRGIVSAKSSEEGPRLEGAVAGFELARSAASVPELIELVEQTKSDAEFARDRYNNDLGTLDDYWKARYIQLQVEMVYEVLNVGLHLKGSYSARAASIYADIVGVRRHLS